MISATIKRCIRGALNDTSWASSSQLSSDLTFDSNNVFNRFITVEVNNDEFEIPLIAKGAIEYQLRELHNNNKKIIIPLYSNTFSADVRTFDSFIRHSAPLSFSQRLCKLITKKGEVYYGGRGLILDNNFNPLLFCSLKAKRFLAPDDTEAIHYIQVVTRISPSVFQEKSMVNTGIISKIIPLFSNMSFYLDSFPYTFRSSTFRKTDVKDILDPLIIIGNIDDLVIEPVPPKPTSNINEDLNQFLVDNLDTIISVL